MNFKINNFNFGTQYFVNGKNTSKQTNDVYQNEIDRLERNRLIATQSQEYMQLPHIQKAMGYLPCDTFVKLHTGIIDREGKKKDDILSFSPFLSFETSSINEQINLSRELGKNGDILKLSLNEDKTLNSKAIDNWFADLLSFYNTQK